MIKIGIPWTIIFVMGYAGYQGATTVFTWLGKEWQQGKTEIVLPFLKEHFDTIKSLNKNLHEQTDALGEINETNKDILKTMTEYKDIQQGILEALKEDEREIIQ